MTNEEMMEAVAQLQRVAPDDQAAYQALLTATSHHADARRELDASVARITHVGTRVVKAFDEVATAIEPLVEAQKAWMERSDQFWSVINAQQKRLDYVQLHDPDLYAAAEKAAHEFDRKDLGL